MDIVWDLLWHLCFGQRGSPQLKAEKWSEKNIFTSASQNFASDDLISVLAPRATNCPDKSIPNAEERHREADSLKGSSLIRVSASTNREERNDRSKRWK